MEAEKSHCISYYSQLGEPRPSWAEEGGEMGHVGHSLELYGPQAGERGRVAAGGKAELRESSFVGSGGQSGREPREGETDSAGQKADPWRS